jgi:hypothetical protein
MLPQILVLFALKSDVDKIVFVTLGGKETDMRKKKSHNTIIIDPLVYKNGYFISPTNRKSFFITNFSFFLTQQFPINVKHGK